MKTLRVDFDQPGAAVHQASSPLQALSGQVALRVEHAPRLPGRPGGEDDHGRVIGAEIRDLGGSLLRAVFVEGIGYLGHRHRGDPVGQLAEQLLLADAEPWVRRGHPDLQVLPPELRIAGERDRAHPETGEHRQHPLDPAPHQRHHGVAAPDPARRHRAGEPGAAGDQLAEVPLAPVSLGVDGEDAEGRSGGPLHHVLDEVHVVKSAAAARFLGALRGESRSHS
jgi:hypothetical protein